MIEMLGDDIMNLKKNTYPFLILIGVVIISFLAVLVLRNDNYHTIEEILNININDISYVKTGGALIQDEDYSVDDFIKYYKNLKYKKVNQSTGNTAHIYYVCYDRNDKILFTLVEIGNKGLIYLKNGLFNINDDNGYLYQLEQ